MINYISQSTGYLNIFEILFQRPERCCPFCQVLISGGKLSRHIKRNHKYEPQVKKALDLPKSLQVGDMPPGRGPHGRFPGRRFHVAVSAKDVSQVAVKFIDVNDF